MVVDGFSPLHLKRRRLNNIDLMEAQSAMAKLVDAKEKLGREIRVFETTLLSTPPDEVSKNAEESDDFYEFTAEDYFRILATKKEDKFLKTRKIRESEKAARKSRITKAIIRVRFPDNHTLEATFHPSETVQSLVDLLTNVIAQPDYPFYIYTTPPKKQIKDMSLDFYSAGFVPGAIVYFSYDQPRGDDSTAADSFPFLKEDIMALKGLETITEQAEPVHSVPEIESEKVIPSPSVSERKPAEKKTIKPKWLRM